MASRAAMTAWTFSTSRLRLCYKFQASRSSRLAQHFATHPNTLSATAHVLAARAAHEGALTLQYDDGNATTDDVRRRWLKDQDVSV